MLIIYEFWAVAIEEMKSEEKKKKIIFNVTQHQSKHQQSKVIYFYNRTTKSGTTTNEHLEESYLLGRIIKKKGSVLKKTILWILYFEDENFCSYLKGQAEIG